MKKMKYVSILALGLITLTSCGSKPITYQQVEDMIIANYTKTDFDSGEGAIARKNSNYPDTVPSDPALAEAHYAARAFVTNSFGAMPEDIVSDFSKVYLKHYRVLEILDNMKTFTSKEVNPTWGLNGKVFNMTAQGSYLRADYANLGFAYHVSLTSMESGFISALDLVVAVRGEPNTEKKDVTYVADFSFTVELFHV